MGEKRVRDVVKKACDILKISKDGYTTHTFRRSAATILADNGSTLVNLKRQGRWTSDTVAESYINNSRKIKLERLVLLGDSLSLASSAAAARGSLHRRSPPNTPEPSPKTAKTDGRNSIEAKAGTVIYSNCNMYTGGTMTFGTPLPPPPPVQNHSDNLAFLSACINLGKNLFPSGASMIENSDNLGIENGTGDEKAIEDGKK